MVVIAVIAILAALLLPAVARAKAQGQSVSCLSNLRQLQAGWLMYVHDNHDAIPPNNSVKSGFIQSGVSNAWGNSWVWLNAQRDTNSANIEHGVIFPDVGSPAVYRCPADRSTVIGRPDLRRFRSYSASWCLNVHIKSGDIQEAGNDNPINLRKFLQIVNPPPTKTLVFIDEHEQSIGDGVFGLPVPWFGGDAPADDRKKQLWGASMPADRHSQGCNLSFADGHVEHYHWLSPKKGMSEGNVQRPANPQDLKDMERLQDLIPRR